MRSRALWVFVLALLLVAGCGGPSVVGKWTGQAPAAIGPPGTLVMTFKADGTYLVEIDGSPRGKPVKFAEEGTWKARTNSGKLVVDTHATLITANGKEMKLPGVPMSHTSEVTFQGDTMTSVEKTPRGTDTQTLTRAKG